MSDYVYGGLSLVSTLASASFFASSAFGIYKIVNYFTREDKQKAISADAQRKWNSGQNILIGHEDASQSVLTAIVNKDESQINAQTYTNVTKRLAQIAEEFGAKSDVHVYLRTPGGQMFFATAIARLFAQWEGRVIAHIHHYSFSGGTIIAIACAEIHMTHSSALGPIDPQHPNKETHFSVVQYLKAVGVDPTQLSDSSFAEPFLRVTPQKSKRDEKNGDQKNAKRQKSALPSPHAKEIEKTQEEEEEVAKSQHAEEAEEVVKELTKDSTDEEDMIFGAEARIRTNMKIQDAQATLLHYRRELRYILARNYANADMSKEENDAKIDKIIDFLWQNRPHCMPIYVQDCFDIGLNVVLEKEYEQSSNPPPLVKK